MRPMKIMDSKLNRGIFDPIIVGPDPVFKIYSGYDPDRFKAFRLTEEETNAIKSNIRINDVANGIFKEVKVKLLEGLDYDDNGLYYLGFMNKTEIEVGDTLYRIRSMNHVIGELDYTFYHITRIIRFNGRVGDVSRKVICVYGKYNLHDFTDVNLVRRICDKCFIATLLPLNRKMRRAKGNVINVSNKGNTMVKSGYGGKK
jgi:hypothetical protein